MCYINIIHDGGSFITDWDGELLEAGGSDDGSLIARGGGGSLQAACSDGGDVYSRIG